MRDDSVNSSHTPIVDGPVFNGMHPRVYSIMVALAIWFAIWAWIGFGASGYDNYVLAVITGFIFLAIVLQLIAGHEWRQFRTWLPDRTDDFSEWLSSEFQVNQTHMPARTAMLELLLPLMAAAFSMMAFAIVALVLS